MRILIPLDGPELLDGVVPIVRRLVGLTPDAELHLLQVLDPKKVQGRTDHQADMSHLPVPVASNVAPIVAPGPRIVESHGEALARVHEETIEWLQAVGTMLPAPASTHAVWSRKPAAEILRFADTVDADVIVMATHGRTGIAHFVNGSVMEEVVRQSVRPVVVVGPSYVPSE